MSFQGSCDARQGCRFADGPLPDSDYGPTIFPKSLRDAPVAPFVRLNLVSPEFSIGSRQILAPAAVPEAAVHEHGDFAARPRKIGLACNWPMLPVATDASGP